MTNWNGTNEIRTGSDIEQEGTRTHVLFLTKEYTRINVLPGGRDQGKGYSRQKGGPNYHYLALHVYQLSEVARVNGILQYRGSVNLCMYNIQYFTLSQTPQSITTDLLDNFLKRIPWDIRKCKPTVRSCTTGLGTCTYKLKIVKHEFYINM